MQMIRKVEAAKGVGTYGNQYVEYVIYKSQSSFELFVTGIYFILDRRLLHQSGPITG